MPEKAENKTDFDYKDFFKRLYKKAMDEEITSRAAQVGFYFVFALFPLLLFIISLFGLILRSGKDLQQKLFGYLGQVMPASAFDLVTKTLNDVVNNSSGGTLTLGFIIALWSASAGMDSIILALNDVYDFTEDRPWWKRKLTSVLLTLAVSLLIFFAVALGIYGSDLIDLLLSAIGIPILPKVISGIISFVVVVAVLLLILTLIYAFGPNHEKFTWNWINSGSIAALVLWILFSIGFRVYLHYFDSYAQTYGSVGAIIILLLWLYLTALVILIGGTINALLDKSSGETADDNVEEKKAQT